MNLSLSSQNKIFERIFFVDILFPGVPFCSISIFLLFCYIRIAKIIFLPLFSPPPSTLHDILRSLARVSASCASATNCSPLPSMFLHFLLSPSSPIRLFSAYHYFSAFVAGQAFGPTASSYRVCVELKKDACGSELSF